MTLLVLVYTFQGFEKKYQNFAPLHYGETVTLRNSIPGF